MLLVSAKSYVYYKLHETLPRICAEELLTKQILPIELVTGNITSETRYGIDGVCTQFIKRFLTKID